MEKLGAFSIKAHPPKITRHRRNPIRNWLETVGGARRGKCSKRNTGSHFFRVNEAESPRCRRGREERPRPFCVATLCPRIAGVATWTQSPTSPIGRRSSRASCYPLRGGKPWQDSGSSEPSGSPPLRVNLRHGRPAEPMSGRHADSGPKLAEPVRLRSADFVEKPLALTRCA